MAVALYHLLPCHLGPLCDDPEGGQGVKDFLAILVRIP